MNGGSIGNSNMIWCVAEELAIKKLLVIAFASQRIELVQGTAEKEFLHNQQHNTLSHTALTHNSHAPGAYLMERIILS